MKSILLIVFFCTAAFCSLLGQNDSKADTIYMTDGRKILAKIINVSSTKVTYKMMSGTRNEEVDRTKVKQIVYSDGTREVSIKSVYTTPDADIWKKVVLTDNPKDIAGMTGKGDIEANSEGDFSSIASARKYAEASLQKKAYGLGATVVLITKRSSTGGYGESPGYYMFGTAYSKK